ncbi:MAG TPA: TIGR03118 family protein [Kofleriaceae bacterium]|jgi:uncharacterized protein (TIGR03118 family)|nr:TIGR03118 family protein [Kofleriaceae bacterium]
MRKHFGTTAAAGAAALIGGAIWVGSAHAADGDADDQTAYQQTNLVSNVAGLAPTIDPNLLNPWGIAWAPGGALWASDNNGSVSTLYNGAGAIVPLVVTIPPADSSAPTGMVWNPNPNQFVIPGTTVGATFIFNGEDGTITAWNPAADPVVAGKSTASLVIDNSASGAVYKGLAYGTNARGNFIFATNFNSGRVEAYDTKFTLTALDGAFTDPGLPAGYAPFGISNIDGDLFVTYARQDAAKHDPVRGDGLGFVDVFTTNGKFVRRFASRGVLNAPWGVVRAPLGFGRFGGEILVGNFGNTGRFAGWISAFNNRGSFLGELRGPNGRPIAIDGLWALSFGTFATSDGDTLYFTAGIHDEADGLFGKLTAVAGRDR